LTSKRSKRVEVNALHLGDGRVPPAGNGR